MLLQPSSQPQLVPAVASLHPSFVLRGNPQSAVQLFADIARAVRIARAGGWQASDDIVICMPQYPGSVDRAVDLMTRWQAERRAVAIDVETTGRDRKEAIDPRRCALKSVAVAAQGGNTGVSFPVVGEYFGLHDRARLLAALRALYSDPEVAKIFFNFSFDTAVLSRHGFALQGEIRDMLIRHHVVEPDSPHDLAYVAHTYLDSEPWKDAYWDLGAKATMDDNCHYNCLDAIRTAQLDAPLWQDIQARSLENVVEAETRWAKVAARMEAVGIPIHHPTLVDFGQRLRTQVDAALDKCKQACGYADLNLNRDVEARWFLYDVLRLPVRRWTPEDHLPSTSYKAIVEHIADPQKGPVVQAYIKWLEASHDYSTFIEGVDKRILPATARLHPSWNVTGQVGSRWSSRPNVSNWPVHLRPMVKAPPGKKLIQADQSQLEYRISAALAGAKKLIEIFADTERDAHTEMARFVFGAAFDIADPARRKLLRTLVKRVVYALQYGAGVLKIVSSLREDRKLPVEIRALLTPERVQQIYDGFFAMNPEVKVFREGLLRQVESSGYLEIPPLGRRRYFLVPEPNKVFNWPIQTLGSDVVNLALANIAARLPPGAETLVHGHDAGLWECWEKDVDLVQRIVNEEMRFTLQGPAGSVELYGEAEVVDAWYEGAAEWPT